MSKYIGDISNTDYTKFDLTGHQTMVGDAMPWRDELTDVVNIKVAGIGVAVNPTENTVDFLHTAEENDYMYCNIQLNHDRKVDGIIYPHIHWFSAEEAVVPYFEIWYRWQVNGATKTTTWTKLACRTLAFAAPAAGVTKHQICGTAAGISAPAGSTISDIVQFRIIRNHSDTSNLHPAGDDPYTATVSVMAFDIHFQINSLGSTEEYTK